MTKSRQRAFPEDLGLVECALCGATQEDGLRLSHIVPSFVFRRLKDTAVTGGLRAAGTPNLRRQDGWKARLLCGECEMRLGAWEREAAQGVFHPLHEAEGLTPCRYDPAFHRFAVSVVWRSLTAYRRALPLSHLSEQQHTATRTAEERWRRYLHGEARSVGRFHVHVLPLGPIEGGDLEGFPPNINRYFMRAVDVDVVSSPSTTFVYAKLMRLLLFGMVSSKRGDWKRTKLRARGGVLGDKNPVVPAELFDFMAAKASTVAEALHSMSDRQKGRVASDISKNRGRVADSDLAAVVMQDVALFGSRAVKWSDS